MNGRFLLDTNIVIALFSGEGSVVGRLTELAEVFVPSIVPGELYYGARKSGRVQENVDCINDFAADSVVLVCDVDTARWYGQIKSDLRAKGRPIPENDIWVAALAMQYELTLATRDGHFDEVEGLVVAAW